MEAEYTIGPILKMTAAEGMPSAFRFCRDDKKYKRILFSDVENLKSMVRVGMGKFAVKTRKDLNTLEEWKNFCQSVANGFVYAYAFDPETLEIRTAFDFPPSEKVVRFDVVGLVPEKDTKCFHFSATVIRQQEGFDDVEKEGVMIFLGAFKSADVLEWYIEFILKAAENRSLAKFLVVTDGKTTNVQKELKDDDKLHDSVLANLRPLDFEKVLVCDVKLITSSETWRSVLKLTKLRF
jgi:hypothetical protein